MNHVRVSIKRHARTVRGGVGEMLGNEILNFPDGTVVPREDELITVHPDNEPSERTWTGRVLGVQHVYCAGSTVLFADKPFTHTVCLTVLDDREVR